MAKKKVATFLKKMHKKHTRKGHSEKLCIRKFGLPTRPDLFVRLKYASSFSITPIALGLINCVQYRGNSCYDPNVALGGHQPYYFDQLNNMGYTKIAVYASQVLVRANINVATPASTMLIAVRADTDLGSDTGLDMTQIEERNLTKFKQVSQARPLTLKKRYTTDYMLGWKRGQSLLIPDNIADFAHNPTQGWVWNLDFQSKDRAIDCTCDIDVTITYYVKIFGRIEIAES